MKKILLSFLVVVLSSIAAYAQGQLFGTTLDLKETASPGNPNIGYRRVRVDSSGVVYIRQNNGTEVSVLTSSINTDLVTEGSTNLYFTNARARAALSAGTGISYNSTTGEISLSGGGGGGALSALTAATASNDIDNANNSQIWRWNTLAGATGLQLASSSTAAASNAQKLLEILSSGANSNTSQTTYSGYFSNTHTGTSSTNVGLYLNASGATNNYGLIVANGRFGLRTTTPAVDFDMGSVLAGERLLIFNDSFTRMGFGVNSADLLIYSTQGTNGGISFGFRDSGSPFNYTQFWRLSNLGSMSVDQGTRTTSQPFINQTAIWNSGATTFHNFTSNITDNSSASASTLFRFQVGGTNKIYGRKDGYLFAGNGFIGNFVSFYDHVAFGYVDFAGSPSTSAGFIQVGSIGSTIVQTPTGGEIIANYNGSNRAKLENNGSNWDFSLNNNYLKVKQLAETVNAAGNSSTAITINWNNGSSQTVTLTDNATFTLSNPVAGATYTLVLTQDGTGSRTATWPGSVVWPGGTAPTLTTTASKVDIVELKYIGSSYYGRVYGLNY